MDSNQTPFSERLNDPASSVPITADYIQTCTYLENELIRCGISYERQQAFIQRHNRRLIAIEPDHYFLERLERIVRTTLPEDVEGPLQQSLEKESTQIHAEYENAAQEMISYLLPHRQNAYRGLRSYLQNTSITGLEVMVARCLPGLVGINIPEWPEKRASGGDHEEEVAPLEVKAPVLSVTGDEDAAEEGSTEVASTEEGEGAGAISVHKKRKMRKDYEEVTHDGAEAPVLGVAGGEDAVDKVASTEEGEGTAAESSNKKRKLR